MKLMLRGQKSHYIIDVIFVVDATGSMADDINIVKESLYDIVNTLKKKKKKLDIRFGMVAYRDHPPEDKTFVTKFYPPTDNIDAVLRFISELEIGGGGDPPEAVADGLWAAYNATWRRDAYKIIILIGDAPPHGYTKFAPQIYGVKDRWPNGCPVGLDILNIVHNIKDKPDMLFFVVGCNPYVHDSFLVLANEGNGKYFDIREAKQLPDVIIASLSKVLDIANFDEKVLNYYIHHDGVFNIEDCARDLGVSTREVKISLARLFELGRIPSWPKGRKYIDKIYETPRKVPSESIEIALKNLPTAAPADDLLSFNVNIRNITDNTISCNLIVSYTAKDVENVIHEAFVVLEPNVKRVETISWRTPFNLVNESIIVKVKLKIDNLLIKEVSQTIFLY